jgi:quercetin dioxygenase-like cupin family protein
MTRQKPNTFESWYIKSAYQDFVRDEGALLYEGSAIEDLATLPLADWKRRGGKVAYTRLGEQEHYCLQIVEIPPGGELRPERHMYDALMFVLSGGGLSTIWQPGEKKRTIEWEEGSLLAIPLNAFHQEFNRSGSAPCRLLFATNMAHAINLYNNIDFIFNNSYAFTDRYSYADEDYLTENTQWEKRLVETNFIPDVRTVPLDPFPERGNRTSIMRISMAGTSLGMHIMGVSPGTYVTAHRHGPGAHVMVISGEGYELLFNQGEKERRKVTANPYAVVAPKLNEFHQHFNTGSGEYRMLAFRHTGLRYGWGTPYSNARTVQSKDPNAWAFKIPYEQEDPEIREDYYRELAAKGIDLRLNPIDQ